MSGRYLESNSCSSDMTDRQPLWRLVGGVIENNATVNKPRLLEFGRFYSILSFFLVAHAPPSSLARVQALWASAIVG